MSALFPVSNDWQKMAKINPDQYTQLMQKSQIDSDSFWAEQAEKLHWYKKWDKVSDCSFAKPVNIQWFINGKLNLSYNCIDRHLEKHADKVAFYWEPDNPNESGLRVTYQELHDQVCRMANVLKASGVKKSDTVSIYLPMIPEAIYAVLACARIGAIHSVVFAGFSSDALADRIQDCESKYLITADQSRRSSKTLNLQANAIAAANKAKCVEKIFVVKHTNALSDWDSKLCVDIKAKMQIASVQCEPEIMDAEDPLFILYTSGSTNKPKGVLHTSGGYLTYAAYTHSNVFDYQLNDVYWCAADVGWITGHSYIVYGPFANAATQVIFEGVPTYPDASRIWQIVDKYKVNILYTAPTLIRSLMKEGTDYVLKTSRQSLRLLGSVGEPINPEAWLWYHKFAGNGNCPIVDTWWQTETGGIMISPLPGCIAQKPGSATKALFGIEAVVLDPNGKELSGECEGLLCIKKSWPGQARSLYKNHDRFYETYFSAFPNYYFTGDACRRDQDSYFWITGRVDDVINVSGHRMGTAEIESALVAHPSVAEAAVVGIPHDIKGQAIYAYVSLNTGIVESEELRQELKSWVKKQIGAIAGPEHIHWAPQLPKTRSGKIMRRILRKIAENIFDSLGDTSTLADPEVLNDLIRSRSEVK